MEETEIIKNERELKKGDSSSEIDREREFLYWIRGISKDSREEYN